MSIVCASTDCKYSSKDSDSSQVIFIHFPNDDTAKIWAHNCGRADLIMKSNEELHANYYICSHHIEDRCYIRKVNPIIIEQGAIPTLFGVDSIGKNHSTGIFDRAGQSELTDNAALTYCDANVEIDQYQGIGIRLSNLCRICGEPSSDGIDVFTVKGIELRLKDKINLHLPISVNMEDIMPQKICIDCCNKLEIAHSLVTTCLKTDMRLRRFLDITGEPEYDHRYNILVEECSLEIVDEMCMDERTQNDALSFPADKAENIVMDQDLTELKDCPASADLQVEIIDASSSLETNVIQDIKFQELSKNDIHAELSNLVETYTEIENNDTDNLIECDTNVLDTNTEKEHYEILCLHCKDSFKTQEMFENHEIFCDAGESLAFPKIRDTSFKDNHKKSVKKQITHLQIVTNTCSTCQQVFDRKEQFEKHKISHCKMIQHVNCQTCGQIFESRKDLDIHVNVCHNKICENNITDTSKKCGHCQAIYCTRKELSNHILECHKGQLLFQCFACDKTYEKWSSLDVHEATHRMDKPFLCDLCGKSFKHSNNLRGHKRIHLDESKKKRHVCELCGNAFRSRFHLREHMNQHDGNKPYSCEQCGKAFYKRIQLRQHKLSHGLNRYVCPVCGVTFNRRGNMSTHVKRHNNGDGAYTCSVCTHRCKSMSELKMHRKKHTEQEIIESIRQKCSDKTIWQCKICSRIFSKRAVLQNHERIHAGDKNTVECDECGKKLSSKNSLIYHKRSIHSKERPHMCQYCGESFVSKEARLIHERIHTGERPYVCKVCNMQYRCSSNLSQHMKIHSDIRPHKCHYCNKTFTRKGALNVHERIHTGIKPFPCDVCGRTFSQKNDMLKHTKTHSVKSLQCEQCNEVFSTKKDLLKHIALHDQNATVIQEYVEVEQQLQPYTINISCSVD